MNKILFLIFAILCSSCKNENKPVTETETTIPYFEGIITVSESRGLYGSLFKNYTTYSISENYIKREQKLGGITSVFDIYAGIIIDLKKDRVILYHADKLMGTKNKHTINVKEYKTNTKYKSLPISIPSTVDNTYKTLPDYNIIKQVKDSIILKEFKCDYTIYRDDSKILKQEVFDTKEIKVKRELLQMMFMNIPEETNFPLKSTLRTTVSDISNDSILNGQQTKVIDLFLRDVFQKNKEETDLEKLSKNKWINLGLKTLKKGVDLNINISSDMSEITSRKLSSLDLPFLSADFKEVSDIDVFINSLPHEGGDFDD